MQATRNISIKQLQKVAEAIYGQGEVFVKQAYSDFDSSTREFANVNALMLDMAFAPDQRNSFFNYTIYYPEAGGWTFEKRIELKPESCDGHKYRFNQNGWGLIQFQCNFKNFPDIECRIAVNSDARANNWFQTFPELKDPTLWNWEIINKKTSKLIRLLRK